MNWLFRFDPWSLLEGLKRKAISQGTIFVKAEAVGFEAEELNNDGIINQRLKRVHVINYLRHY